MPRVSENITNTKTLESKIAKSIAKMEAKYQKQAKLAVGGQPQGLTLQITRAGAATWLWRTTINGKRREIGLGNYRRAGAPSRETAPVSLADAREMAGRMFEAVRSGIDPIAALQTSRQAKKSFKDAATAYVDKEKAQWSDKHAAQWPSTLKKWVYDRIGDKPIEAIDLADVESVLLQPVPEAGGAPLWTARHVTARRVRQRIEAVLDYAAAKGERDDLNPARLVGPLSKLLPGGTKKKKIHTVRSHKSMPYTEAPAFMAELRGRAGTAAQALQFTIYTAARSGEVRHADWSEIDLDAALWVRPADKMKAGEAHTVPLSAPALAILTAIPETRRTGRVFPSTMNRDKPMSDMTLAAVLKRMKRTGITVHGFRSTFRTWADEQTTYNRNVKESAIAHAIGETDVERAYLRSDYLPQRTLLMQHWAEYISKMG